MSRSTKSWIATSFCGAACLVAAAMPGRAQSAPDSELFGKPFTWTADLQVLAGADLEQVRDDGNFNPQNRIAGLADAQGMTEFRPDFTAKYGRLSFDFGPRLLVDPVLDSNGESSYHSNASWGDFYVNRWRVKAQLTDSLSAWYGRDTLQWGNSVFRSPSNPFYADNGRLNPIEELPGQDFAVLTYAPSQSYAISLVSNTGQGHASLGGEPFRVTNAIKFDYVGKALNAVIIGSKKQGMSPRLGGSFTYSASDAVLVYGEASVSRGSNAFYPEPSSNAAGWLMTPLYQDSGRVFFTNLLGASYTFPKGLVVAGEYLHSNEGYTQTQAGALSSLGRSASALVDQGGSDAALGAQLLGQAINTGLRVERRNYLFVQVLKADYRNRADLSASYAANLDDRGGTFAGYATYSINNRTQLFAVGAYNVGSGDTEFARLQRSTLSIGVRLFFSSSNGGKR